MEMPLQDQEDSYDHAKVAYQLTKTAIATNLLVYDELGVYKVLSDLRHEDTGEAFIREVLGELIDYDEKENTDYLDILKAFFENECSIVHTAQKMYFNKKTMNYKMNKVKENIKPNKLFISHSSKDVEYIKLFVELLEDIGMPDGSIVCTSVAGHGIPGGEKIYQWLRKQFVECDIRVVFALSHNYYASPASLNEMGAAWITRSTDTLLLLPGFDFSDIKGSFYGKADVLYLVA